MRYDGTIFRRKGSIMDDRMVYQDKYRRPHNL